MLKNLPSILASITSVSLLTLSFSTYASDSLRVVHNEAFPPFIYLENGKTTGLAADLLNAAAEKANIVINYVPVPFAEIQGSLDTKADAIFPLAINDERKKIYDFSSPVFLTGGAFFVLKPDSTPVDLEELKNKKITTPKSGPLANYRIKNYPESTVLVTKNYDESLEQLIKKDAEVAALNLQVGTALAEQQHPGSITLPDELFLPLPMALAVKKSEHSDLLSRLNQGLEQITREGIAEEINQSWMQKK